VLINITGGMEMTLGDVTTISDIVKEAVGEESEIIFGAVNEPAMQGEVRVTVIATGFERKGQQLSGGLHHRAGATPIIPLDRAREREQQRDQRPSITTPSPSHSAPAGGSASPRPRPQQRPMEDLSDMEIPTFIRRQMD
jgi:cell division protein FtsZ